MNYDGAGRAHCAPSVFLSSSSTKRRDDFSTFDELSMRCSSREHPLLAADATASTRQAKVPLRHAFVAPPKRQYRFVFNLSIHQSQNPNSISITITEIIVGRRTLALAHPKPSCGFYNRSEFWTTQMSCQIRMPAASLIVLISPN
jgi:hypothetical protein